MDSMEEDERKDIPKLEKLKEEYNSFTSDFNSVFLWMQRELLASQTLTDLAKNSRRTEETIKKKTKKKKRTPPPSPAGGSSDEADLMEEDEMMTTSSGEEECCKEETSSNKDVWAQYIPPSQTTITTLETTNKTERNVMALPSSPPARTIPGDEMMDIAHALEDLHCEGGKKRHQQSFASGESMMGPKPKKRRRRRHEIARNFKCSLNGCTKSYGSEGALKTHIRLKHAENGELRKHKDPPHMSWMPPPSAGIGGPILLPPPPQSNGAKSLAGDKEMFKPPFVVHRNEGSLPPLTTMIHHPPNIPLPHSTVHRENIQLPHGFGYIIPSGLRI